MDNKLRKQVIDTVKDVMDVDISSMEGSKKFSEIPNWDSFNNLMLISRFQDDLKVEFTAVELERTQKLDDLFSLIERKVSKRK